MKCQSAAQWSPIRVILTGLLVSQLLFALFVYDSNLDLLKRLESISAAGYVPVPNNFIMAGLDGFLPAFCGGLFFTFTTGAGLCLASFILICLWSYPGKRRPQWLLPVLILWEFGFFQALGTGRPLTVGASFLVIPPLVAVLTRKWLDAESCRAEDKSRPGTSRLNRPGFVRSIRGGIIHGLVISGIVLVWLPNLNAGVFVNIRDHLLLSNPAGRTINDFYYRYTLYPAEAFKSLYQKQLKTSRIRVNDKRLFDRLEKTLRRLDYLPIKQDIPVDLEVCQRGHKFLLSQQGRVVMETKPARFFGSTRWVLERFSEETDQMEFFREFTFVSLVTAAPLLLYMVVHAFFSAGLAFFSRGRCGRAASVIICLAIAAAAALPLYQFGQSAGAAQNSGQIHSLLASENQADRIQALKQMAEGGMDPHPFRERILSLKQSPHTAERYWIARVLGQADSKRARQMLLGMLSDPHPNVVCAALYSLGKHHDPAALPLIRRILISSDHWYIQFYAYNALKELGWRQPESV